MVSSNVGVAFLLGFVMASVLTALYYSSRPATQLHATTRALRACSPLPLTAAEAPVVEPCRDEAVRRPPDAKVIGNETRNVAQLYELDYDSVEAECAQRGDGGVVQGVRCCAYSRARAWLSKHAGRTPHSSKVQQFEKIIRQFSRAMASIRMPWHMMGGTLLGWQRECGIIAHTTDIDMAIMEEDWRTDDMDKALKAFGFKYHQCLMYDKVGWELTYKLEGTDIKVDIRQMCREKYYTWMGAGQPMFGRHARWEGHYHIVPASFHGAPLPCPPLPPPVQLCLLPKPLGIPVGIPEDPDRYLFLEYGPYEEPDPHFEWDTGARNLVMGVPRWRPEVRCLSLRVPHSHSCPRITVRSAVCRAEVTANAPARKARPARGCCTKLTDTVTFLCNVRQGGEAESFPRTSSVHPSGLFPLIGVCIVLS